MYKKITTNFITENQATENDTMKIVSNIENTQTEENYRERNTVIPKLLEMSMNVLDILRNV